MKNPNSKTVKTPATDKPVTDPIEVAKRNLDFARADYRRIKEINAGPKAEQQVDPKRKEVRDKIAQLKVLRKENVERIKQYKAAIEACRATIKEIAAGKRALQGSVKKMPRPVRNKAVKDAQIALLEAELAYRKACLG